MGVLFAPEHRKLEGEGVEGLGVDHGVTRVDRGDEVDASGEAQDLQGLGLWVDDPEMNDALPSVEFPLGPAVDRGR